MALDCGLKFKRGQTTSEYVIGITLVAIATIGLFAAYGSDLRMKLSTLAGALSGNSEVYEEAQLLESIVGYEASVRARRSVDMKGGEGDELEYGLGRD